MNYRVSVIIPHYNDLAGLDACLTALGNQSTPPDEIVVADNNSPQGMTAVTATVAGRARLVIVNERGAGSARNGAVRESTGDILAFTDSDCIPDQNWLKNGLAALTNCDFAGGKMSVLVQNEYHLTAAEAFERVFAFDNKTYVQNKYFTVTANLICPRNVFNEVGDFKVGVPEDLEWCQRARQKGFRIGYAANAVVGHPARRTWKEIEGKWKRLNDEAFNLAILHKAGRLRWLLKALGLPMSALIHTPKILTSPALTKIKDRSGALTVLYRLRLWRSLNAISLLIFSWKTQRYK